MNMARIYTQKSAQLPKTKSFLLGLVCGFGIGYSI